MENDQNKNFIPTLIILVLLISVINLVVTYRLSAKFGAISQTLSPETADGQEAQNPSPSNIEVSADDDPFKGSADAPITIIEFSDFECSFCARFTADALPQLIKTYIDTGKVKLVFRDYPLPFHKNAQKAAEAAECAVEQGKFWEYHDKVFANQNSLGVTSLKQYAKDLGLDSAKFDQCLDSGKMAQEVKKDFSDGTAYGVDGTPTFFINGVKLVGAQPLEAFAQIIEQELQK